MASPLDPIHRRDWDEPRARHLLNRAGFGIPLDLVAKLARMEPAEACGYFVDYERHPPEFEEPAWTEVSPEERAERIAFRRDSRRRMRLGTLDESEREALQAEIRKSQAIIRREQRQDLQNLKTWWLRRMIETPRPLEEKLTLFWHGHFATSAEKVRSPQANYDLNALFRAAATGNFKLLTYEVGCSPAMMLYLDNARSRKEHPNENWARELMELYTLGQGHYTEDDIKAAARAFTGWTTDGENFAYRPAIHDEGEKVFMGRRGNLNGNDIFDIIFARPEAAEFISTKLWEFFAYEDPEPEIRRGLGQTLYRSGYELKPLLRQMFLSRAFYGERARGSRIKSPVELVISMVDALEVEPDPLVENYLTFATGRMGQDLFHAPNVKGWPGGKTWISAGTLMSRYNASNFLTQGLLTDASPALRQQVAARFRNDRQFLRSQRQARRRALAQGRVAPARQAQSGGMDMGGMDSGMADPAMSEAPAVVSGPEGIRLPKVPANVRAVFEPYSGMSISRVVEALASRLYVVPPSAEQVRQFTLALAAGASSEDQFDATNWPENRLQGTLHLMMSAAEFQLC